MRPFRSIAIDGPSGAGKSTLAKALAARLGFLYVDTGAIYRTVGLYVAEQFSARTSSLNINQFHSGGQRYSAGLRLTHF